MTYREDVDDALEDLRTDLAYVDQILRDADRSLRRLTSIDGPQAPALHDGLAAARRDITAALHCVLTTT